MKKKTIAKTIRSKMNEWIKTLPPDLNNEVQDSIIVTGGCIASMLLQEEINDFDIYFTNTDTLEKVAKYYTRGTKTEIQVDKHENRVISFIPSRGYLEIKKNKKDKYAPIFITDNAISLTNNIQIITRFIGEPDKIHENFDFIHTKNYWTYNTGLIFNKEALVSLLSKELRYVGSKYPLCSIIRTRKFIKRGFTINAGQYLKMTLQLNKINLTDLDILKDQLIGVDITYFTAFLDSIDNKIRKEGKEAITDTFLYNLIDYIFDEKG